MTTKTNEHPGRSLGISMPLMIFYFLLLSCEPDLSDDPIPISAFPSLTINTNLPEYQDLRSKGFTYLDDIGFRGVILYRLNTSTYIAYDRHCSYQPNDACATVDVHISNLYLIDPCCNSTFKFENGDPTGGPAWRPLRKYETITNGWDVTITDQIIE